MTTYVQWRAWIGPRWREQGTAGADVWTQIASGAITPQEAATTLSASLADGATTATLASGTNYPTANGWAFIGPNGSGQAWEYIDYTTRSTNTISGIAREPSAGREHSGAHSSGAAVRLFWPLDTNTGQLTISRATDENLSAETWTAQIAGVAIPPAAVRNEHLIAITYRTDPAASYSLLLLGWIQAPRTKDDYQRRGEWSIQIVSAATLTGGAVLDGIRAGALDIAEGGGASADTDLADSRKEAGSGDYVAADPGLTPGNATDGDANTLWIGERVIGTSDIAGFPSGLTDAHFVSQLFIRRWTGDTRPSRWIELLCKGQQYPNAMLCSSTGANVSVGFGGVQAAFGDRIIICEDKATFEADHPLSDALKIIEIGSAWFEEISVTDDSVGIHFALSDVWTHTTMWGAPANDNPVHENHPDPDQYGESWPGPGITAPQPGKVIRYHYTGAADRADNFATDYAEHAGYAVGDGTDPWLIASLPGMGLTLAEDITASAPGIGAALKIADEGGSASAGGLPASGTIQIAQEQIAYSAKTDDGVTVSARGANGTTAAEHVAGDLIQIVDGGTATDGQPIRQIVWRRRTGGIVPGHFYLYRSWLESPRTPAESNYGSDYEQLADVSSHTADTYTLDLASSRRTRAILIQFERMSTDPARPRLNALEAYLDESLYDADLWLTGTPTAAALIAQVLINAGIPTAAITQNAGTATLTGFSTAKAAAWKVAADLADYSGAWIAQGLNSLIAISANTRWTAGSLTPTTTWTRTNAKAVELVQALNRTISQVKIAWRTPDNSASGTESYPASPASAAAPIEYAEALYANATAAQAAARRRYLQSRYQYQIVIECAEGQPAILPGDVHAVQWQFATDMQQIDRTIFVLAVEHRIEGNLWETVITGQQAERESYT